MNAITIKAIGKQPYSEENEAINADWCNFLAEQLIKQKIDIKVVKEKQYRFDFDIKYFRAKTRNFSFNTNNANELILRTLFQDEVHRIKQLPTGKLFNHITKAFAPQTTSTEVLVETIGEEGAIITINWYEL